MKIFAYFAYIRSNDQTTTFVWKRDCATFSKLDRLRSWPRPFMKVFTNFNQRYVNQIPLNSPYIFDGLLSSLMFKLLQLWHYFDKINQSTFFRKSFLAFQNKIKCLLLWRPNKKLRPLKNKKLGFLVFYYICKT